MGSGAVPARPAAVHANPAARGVGGRGSEPKAIVGGGEGRGSAKTTPRLARRSSQANERQSRENTTFTGAGLLLSSVTRFFLAAQVGHEAARSPFEARRWGSRGEQQHRIGWSRSHNSSISRACWRISEAALGSGSPVSKRWQSASSSDGNGITLLKTTLR